VKTIGGLIKSFYTPKRFLKQVKTWQKFVNSAKNTLKRDFSHKSIRQRRAKIKSHGRKWAQDIESMFLKESMQMTN
jgi:hypothetical protein